MQEVGASYSLCAALRMTHDVEIDLHMHLPFASSNAKFAIGHLAELQYVNYSCLMVHEHLLSVYN